MGHARRCLEEETRRLEIQAKLAIRDLHQRPSKYPSRPRNQRPRRRNRRLHPARRTRTSRRATRRLPRHQTRDNFKVIAQPLFTPSITLQVSREPSPVFFSLRHAFSVYAVAISPPRPGAKQVDQPLRGPALCRPARKLSFLWLPSPHARVCPSSS